MTIIKEGFEWQAKELSEASLEIAEEIRETNPSSASQDADNLAYAIGVGEAIRLLLAEEGVDVILKDSEDVLTKIYERYRERVS